MTEKKLYLIDGHALVYRAYYAFVKNPLTSSKGLPTSAVFGFANYLIRLIESYSCPYLAVVMDSNAPTFRHEMYEQYKANREEMPDDLKVQMPLIRELIDAFNIPVIKQDGLEADDLIGCLTNMATADDFDVFLITKDKDLMQLIGPRVKMLAPDGTGVLQVIDVKDVIEKLGIGPEKIVDYLALIGDASDNIPGVPGVGPKTALKILESGGSVENILINPSVLENPKLIQKIIENKDLLRLSKDLATLKCDIGLSLELDTLIRRTPDREKCTAFFKELGLTSLLRHPLFGEAKRLAPNVNIITEISQIQTLVGQIQSSGYMCIDTQTTGTIARGSQLVGITVALNEIDAVYIPVGHQETANNCDLQAVLDSLRIVIENPDIAKIGQNLKYDYQVFKNYGIKLNGITFDTMIAAYLLDPGKRTFELDVLVSEWLEMDTTLFSQIVNEKKGKTFADLPVHEAAVYAAEMVCLPFLLKQKLEIALIEKSCQKLFVEIEMPLVHVLADLEWQGMLIDTVLLESLSKEYTASLIALSDEVYLLAGEQLNLNSPKQIGEILFDKLLLPAPKKTKSGTHSTSVDILEKLAPDYPIVQKILDCREVQKLLSTYIDALPLQILAQSGRVHSSFNQTVAATGRLSSTNPNLQNIPVRTDGSKRIREAFIAKPGFLLVSADYSQIELRILAHLSKDSFLIQAFENDQDIHTQTASAIYSTFPELVTPEMRRTAKTINFGLMYGMGPINLSRQLGISFGEAKIFIDKYFEQFPTIKNFMETTIQGARELGYTETLLGRKRYHPEINAHNRTIREAAERTAINTPVQGTAADIIKIAMINIHAELGELYNDARMLLQVHDELVFEVPESQSEALYTWIISKMSTAYELIVPLKVDGGMGKNWSEAH